MRVFYEASEGVGSRKGKSILFLPCLHREEMRLKNLSALLSNMDIILSGLGVLFPIEFKDNLTVFTIWNAGETGDINVG